MKIIDKDQGVVIKKTPFWDWAFFTLFSKKNWKIQVFVRNIKSFNKKHWLFLSIWNEIEFDSIKKSSSTSFKDINLIKNIWTLSYEKLVILSYFLEIINNITAENQSNNDFFELIKQSINYLKNENNLLLSCLTFEIKSLTIFWLLHPLNTYVDSSKKINLDKNNIFVPEFWWIVEQEIFENELKNSINTTYKKSYEKFSLKAYHIKLFSFIQDYNFNEIFQVNLPFDGFEKVIYIFRKNLLLNLPWKNKIFPCFLNENMLK